MRNLTLAILTGAVSLAVLACGGDGATAVETPASIRFVSQPSGGTAGQPFSVSVELLNSQGSRLVSGTQSVSLSLVGGGGSLAGTTTASAIGGLATFSGLAITATGANLALFGFVRHIVR